MIRCAGAVDRTRTIANRATRALAAKYDLAACCVPDADSGVAAQPVQELIAKLDQVPEKIHTTVRNNAGGHASHSLFWPLLQKNGGAIVPAPGPR